MKEELLSLLKKYSFKHGDFTLASGQRSPYFIDCKQTLLLGRGHYLAGRLIIDEIIKHCRKIGGVAAVELGGCPLASAVATLSWDHFSLLDTLYIRKAAKDHGTKKLIEGQLILNKDVALLEDTITTGGSSINALGVLKASGYNPVAVISIIDRLEGGSEAITKTFGIPVISLYTIKDFQ